MKAMATSKNILFIYDYMHKLGGVQRVISIVSQEFSREGHQVALLCKDNTKDLKFDFPGNTIKFKIKSKRKLKQRLKDYLTLRLLYSKFDSIIDFREKKAGDYLFEMSTKPWSRQKYICCVSNTKIENYLGPENEMIKSKLGGIRYIICLTDKMAYDVQKTYQVANTKVIPNPIDSENISTSLQTESSPINSQYLFASGRLNTVKGFDLLLHAYSRSRPRADGIKLVILGEGPEEHALKKQAQDLGIIDLVSFEGFVKNPYKYTKKALFFILSSRHEAFGNVLAENLYCEIPAISLDCITGPKYIIKDHFNGLLVSPYDAEELLQFEHNKIVRDEDIQSLTHAMNLLYTNRELREKLKSNARESVQHLDISHISKLWLEVIKDK